MHPSRGARLATQTHVGEFQAIQDLDKVYLLDKGEIQYIDVKTMDIK